MIPPYKKVIRFDILAVRAEELLKSIPENEVDLVEDDRWSQATWDGDDNYQVLKAQLDERTVLAKNALAKKRIAENELREYERSQKFKDENN